MRYQSRLVVAPLQREEAEAFPPGHENRVMRAPGKGEGECLVGGLRSPNSWEPIVSALELISTRKCRQRRIGLQPRHF
jgi:hypothetical protein